MGRGPVPSKKGHAGKRLLTDLTLKLLKVGLRDLCSVSTQAQRSFKDLRNKVHRLNWFVSQNVIRSQLLKSLSFTLKGNLTLVSKAMQRVWDVVLC
jgi:hypothetical protein